VSLHNDKILVCLDALREEKDEAVLAAMGVQQALEAKNKVTHANTPTSACKHPY
jgi:hypothetical protein